jgi:hypothetical protein
MHTHSEYPIELFEGDGSLLLVLNIQDGLLHYPPFAVKVKAVSRVAH